MFSFASDLQIPAGVDLGIDATPEGESKPDKAVID